MVELLGILITHYAWLATWLLSAGLAGLALQSLLLDFDGARAPWPNPELAIFFSISAGLALQVVLLILLASLQQLNGPAVILASAVLAAASLWILWLRPRCGVFFLALMHRPWREWLAIVPVLLVVAAWLVRPLGAAAGSDPLTYHLPYARFYLEHGGLAVNDTLRFPLHTHSVNLLYAVALLRPYTIESPALPQMLHAGMGWLSLLGIYGAARHWSGWPAALLSVLAVLLLDEFVYSFAAAFVDNGLMLFVTGSFVAMALWQETGGRESRGQGWLWLAAILAGTAMGTKYLGAWFTVPLGLWVLWQSRSLGLAIRFALVVSVFGTFWYLRSWWLVGNPVHPFAGEWFGYSIWTAYDLQGQMHELGSHGVEKTWLNLLGLPWKMYTDWHRFNGSVGNAGLLAGAFMLSCLLIRRQNPALRIIHLTCLVYLVFWFYSSQVIRYLMIILPLMSLCAMVLWANTATRASAWLVRQGRLELPASLPEKSRLVGLAMVVLLLTGVAAKHGYRDLVVMPLTAERQREYLLQTQPAYAVARAASFEGRLAHGPILQFQLQELRWFFPGAVIGDWMGRYPFREFGHIGESQHWEINAGDVLAEQIEAIGAVAVAFSRQPGIQFSPQPLDKYLREFEIIFEGASAVLLAPRRERLIAEDFTKNNTSQPKSNDL